MFIIITRRLIDNSTLSFSQWMTLTVEDIDSGGH